MDPMQRGQIWQFSLNKQMLMTKIKVAIKAVATKREAVIKENGWNPNIINMMMF